MAETCSSNICIQTSAINCKYIHIYKTLIWWDLYETNKSACILWGKKQNLILRMSLQLKVETLLPLNRHTVSSVNRSCEEWRKRHLTLQTTRQLNSVGKMFDIFFFMFKNVFLSHWQRCVFPGSCPILSHKTVRFHVLSFSC